MTQADIDSQLLGVGPVAIVQVAAKIHTARSRLRPPRRAIATAESTLQGLRFRGCGSDSRQSRLL
jgi:hypothetical protein